MTSPLGSVGTYGRGEMPLATTSQSIGVASAGQTQGSGTATGTASTGGPSSVSGQPSAAGTTAPSAQNGAATSSSTTSTSTSNGTTSTSGTDVGDLSGTDTFLKLLVAQLQNQDPTSPMDDQAFVTELAQFNTVEQMINMNQSINAQTAAQQSAEAVGMIGKTIAYVVPAVGGGTSTTGQGVVSGVSMAQGQIDLQVNGQQVPISEVTTVS